MSILIVTDLKFCQTENVEQHFWKILFYNLIELLRNLLEHDKENKEKNKSTLLTIIDEASINFNFEFFFIHKSITRFN